MARSALSATAAALAALLGGAAAAASPPPPSTADFVKAAAASDQFEILEGRVASVEGGPRVRAFAQQMIQEHTATTQALAQAASRSGLPPPPMALSGDQSMMLGALQSISGPDFDRTYLRHQVLGHQSALVVEQGYASAGAGADAELRRTARAAVPIIQHHLDMARRMQAAAGEAP